MDPVLRTLGLRPSPGQIAPPNLAPYYVLFNFLFAFAGLSSRFQKRQYKLDHNVAPREDLTQYGSAAVKAGKMTQRQLDRLKRLEGAHANAVENFPLLVAALLMGQAAGVDAKVVNGAGVTYTLIRAAYAVLYVTVETEQWAGLRSVAWWAGNITCLRLLWKAGKAFRGVA